MRTPSRSQSILLAAAFATTAASALASTGASDNASNAPYTDGWQAGDNGGTGFLAWTFANTSSDSNQNGEFIGSANNNGSGSAGASSIDTTGSKSWGLYANNTQRADVTRPFNGALLIGQTLTLDMDNGNISSGNSDGFSLRNSSGQNLFEFTFKGGQSDYTINDSNGQNLTSIPFTSTGLRLTFTLTSPSTYSFTVAVPNNNSTLTTFTGSLMSPAAGQSLDRLRLFNSNAGAGSASDLFFNSMSIQTQAAISASATPDFSTLIVGSSTNVSAHITNSAPTGSMALNYSAAASTSLTGATQTGTLAPQSSANATGFTFSASTVGANQTASITVSDPNASNSPQTASATLDVLDHAAPSLTTASSNFGKVIVNTPVANQSTTLANAVGHRAGLQILNLGGLSRAGSGLIAPGSSDTLSASVDTSSLGSYSQTYTLQSSDDTSIHGAAASSNLTYHVTGTILNHANALVFPNTSSDPRDSSYPNAAGSTVQPDKTVTDSGKTLNINFGTIFSTPSADPYPVDAFFDIADSGLNMADLHVANLSYSFDSNPTGTATFSLTDPGSSNQTPNQYASLLPDIGQSHTYEISFDPNNPSLYLPNSPFTATWKIYLTDALDVTGGYQGSSSLATWDPNYIITIHATATAVPLPTSLTMSTLSLLALFSYRRLRRA